MITLTPAAIEKVKEALKATVDGAVLRVGVRGGGCSGFTYSMVIVTPESVNPDWNEIDCDGLKVCVDQMSAMYLEDVSIDFISDDLGNSGFKFNNPNVKTTCGCGQSFSI